MPNVCIAITETAIAMPNVKVAIIRPAIAMPNVSIAITRTAIAMPNVKVAMPNVSIAIDERFIGAPRGQGSRRPPMNRDDDEARAASHEDAVTMGLPSGRARRDDVGACAGTEIPCAARVLGRDREQSAARARDGRRRREVAWKWGWRRKSCGESGWVSAARYDDGDQRRGAPGAARDIAAGEL